MAEGTPNPYHLLAEGWDCHHAGKQHLCHDPPLERRADSRTHWATLEHTYAPALAARRHPAAVGPDFRADLPELISGLHTGLGSRSTPPDLPGQSLRRPATRPVFIEYDGSGALGNFSRAVIHGPDKLIVDTFKDEFFFVLHQLPTDPLEDRNLIANDPARAAELLALPCAHMRETGDHLALSQAAIDRFLGRFPAAPAA